MHRISRSITLLALVAILFVAAAVAHADTGRFRFRFSVSPWNGVFALGAGDVDGDGIPDVIVPNGNHAAVVSGASGQALFTLSPPHLDAVGLLESSYAVGDLDGDGRNEIVVGAPGACWAGRVYVFSGLTGHLQFSLKSPSSAGVCNTVGSGAFGQSVGLIRARGGGSDIVVGSPAEVDGGRVYIFSGSTYALRRTLAAPSATEDAGFGFNLRAADGDRGPVLAIASFGLPNTPFPQRGRVYVFSGSVTPDFVIENPEPARFQLFGLEGLALEIDRRGNPLLAVGEFSQGEVSHNQGQAFVYSGATQLYKLTSPDPAASNVFGISLTFADLRGFGWSLLVVAPGDTVDGVALSGRVYVFNARGTLSESLTSPHPQANDAFGVPVIVSRGSCETALVVGAPSTDLSGGRVEYFALRGNARDRERCRSRGS